MKKQDILSFDLAQLQGHVREMGHPAFYAKSVFTWVCQKGCEDFGRMSDLPKPLREALGSKFSIAPVEVLNRSRSQDGTEKFLLGLQDGQCVESVVIPAERRTTGCISTQVGCKFACAFCASGAKGFTRHLDTAEILNEVRALMRESRCGPLTHLVFMGTGEPFDNYDHVLAAIRMINAPYGFGIGARRITISTCGVVPGILRLAGEGMQVELSVSLHAADDKTREQLLPVNRKYPIAELMDACGRYIKETNRQVTFEYILIKGVNSDLHSAQKLSILLRKVRLPKVNLIPANPVRELRIEPPAKREVSQFLETLRSAGIPATLRQSRGGDIDAACGQLRLRHEK